MKNITKNIFKYLLLLGLFYLLSRAEVNNSLRIFALPLAGVMLAQNSDNVPVFIAFGVAEFLATFDFKITITSLVFGGVMMLGRLINKKLKIKNGLALCSFYFLVGCLPKVFFVFGYNNIVTSLIFCGLSCGIFVATYVFVTTYKKRKSYLRFSLDEIACGLVTVIGVFCGLYRLNIPYVDLVRLIAPLLMLIACYAELDSLCLCLGTIFGIGVCLGGAGVEYIALFSCMAIVTKLFKSEIRLFSAVSCVCIDIIFGLYFNVFASYTIFNTIAVFVSGGIFMLLPKKLFDYVIINYSKPSTKMAYRNLIGESSSDMAKRLLELSDIFFDMDLGYRKLVRGSLPLDECKNMFVSELTEDCCKTCENYLECHRKFGVETADTFRELANIGFEKGKITLLELPAFLTSRCLRLNVMLPEINGLISKFKKDGEVIEMQDDSKLLIAEQIRGVSKLFYELSQKASEKLTFDTKKEVEITEELAYNDIICSEVAVYQKDKNNCKINMVIRNEDFHNDKLLKCVEKVCHQRLNITSTTPALISGLMVLGLETAPKYDIVFGVAKVTKSDSTASGDNYSLLKLSGSRFLMAICDGMGSGDKAKDMSDKVASLIENFYRADFDSEIILNSINKLLGIKGRDNFSTIDICNIDLSSSLVDFVKLGAVASFIKHQDTITKIESGALPVGVLEEVSPKITKTSLNFGDMVVLVSDGITDSLGDEMLENIILSSKCLAPQEMADTILNKAKNACMDAPIDDMTVLVGKVFKNI